MSVMTCNRCKVVSDANDEMQVKRGKNLMQHCQRS